eukprot:6183713-Pleurochrysis_carterae.AAC.1
MVTKSDNGAAASSSRVSLRSTLASVVPLCFLTTNQPMAWGSSQRLASVACLFVRLSTFGLT